MVFCPRRQTGATRPGACREESPSLSCFPRETAEPQGAGQPRRDGEGPELLSERPERAGCERRRILGGPVGRWRKPGRARGRLSRPFPVRMGFMSKQNRSARSE